MIAFTKLHASGNDFILIKDNFNNLSFTKKEIIKICSRKYGIGGDGLIIIKSLPPRTVVKFYNNDGSKPEMCINGIRCAGYVLKETFPDKYIFQLILPKRMAEVKVKNFDYEQKKAIVEVNIGAPRFDYYGKKFNVIKPLKIKTSAGIVEGYYISFDNPHLVVLRIPHVKLQPQKGQYYDENLTRVGMECQRIFHNGINVEFVNIENVNRINVLFWERGVGWTDSCGSGSCAVAVVLKKHIFKNQDEFIINSIGGIIKVKVDNDFNAYLEGEVYKVFEGYFD